MAGEELLDFVKDNRFSSEDISLLERRLQEETSTGRQWFWSDNKLKEHEAVFN